MPQLATPECLPASLPEDPSPATESMVRKIVRLHVYTTLPVRKIVDILQWLYDDKELGYDHALRLPRRRILRSACNHSLHYHSHRHEILTGTREPFVSKELNAALDRDPQWLHPGSRIDMEHRMAARRSLRQFARRKRADRLRKKAKLAADRSMLGRKRAGRTKSDMSSKNETDQFSDAESFASGGISMENGLGETLSQHSAGFIRHVSGLLDRYSVKQYAASRSGSESAPPSSSTGSSSTEWIISSELYRTDQLLRADEFGQRLGTCIDGRYAHDNNICLCVTSLEDSEASYWAMPTGLTERGRRVLRNNLEQLDVEFSDVFGNTVLHFLGARAGPAQLISALRAGADPSRLNNFGQTFLHMLGRSWGNNTTKVFHLLQYLQSTGREGCLTQRDIYGRTCFHILFYDKGHRLMASLAGAFGEVSHLRSRDAFGSRPIKTSAVSQHHAGETQSNMPSFAEIIAIAEAKLSPSIEKKEELLRFAESCVTDPDKEFNGRNGLHCAAMAILSGNTLEPTTQGDYGKNSSRSRPRAMQENPLGNRLMDCHRLTQALIHSGVDVNGYDLNGDTVLMNFAVQLPEDHGYSAVSVSILQVLINFGADVSARNRNGETALHLAARYGRKLAVRTLCQNGANPSVRDHHDRSVLQILAECLEKCNSEKARAHYEACYAWLSSEENRAVMEPTTVQEWGGRARASAGRADSKASASRAAASINSTRFQTELDKLLRNVVSKDTPTGNDEDLHADPEPHKGLRKPQSGQFQHTHNTEHSIEGSSSFAGASPLSGTSGEVGKYWNESVGRSISTLGYVQTPSTKAISRCEFRLDNNTSQISVPTSK